LKLVITVSISMVCFGTSAACVSLTSTGTIPTYESHDYDWLFPCRSL
jgi:hypothetical protein